MSSGDDAAWSAARIAAARADATTRSAALAAQIKALAEQQALTTHDDEHRGRTGTSDPRTGSGDMLALGFIGPRPRQADAGAAAVASARVIGDRDESFSHPPFPGATRRGFLG